MKPTKFIPMRDPSVDATCTRMLGNWFVGHYCGAPLQLVVTKNPTDLPYEELVVQRCVAGHLAQIDGVLQGEPEEIEGYGL